MGAYRWLMACLPSAGEEAWVRDEPALVLTGSRFDAVRLPFAQAPVRAAVEVFRAYGIRSAVIADPPHRAYYALVPPDGSEPHHVRVPAPHRADPPGAYWLLAPPDGDDELCDPDSVRRLTALSRPRP